MKVVETICAQGVAAVPVVHQLPLRDCAPVNGSVNEVSMQLAVDPSTHGNGLVSTASQPLPPTVPQSLPQLTTFAPTSNVIQAQSIMTQHDINKIQQNNNLTAQEHHEEVCGLNFFFIVYR